MNDFLPMTDQDTQFFTDFGKRLSELRRVRGMTQAELGEQVGVNQTAIGSYEIGRRRIPLSQVPRLAKVLGVSIEELLEPETPSNGRRGPTPKLQRQIEQVSELPRSKQKFVVQMLEGFLTQEAAAS